MVAVAVFFIYILYLNEDVRFKVFGIVCVFFLTQQHSQHSTPGRIQEQEKRVCLFFLSCRGHIFPVCACCCSTSYLFVISFADETVLFQPCEYFCKGPGGTTLWSSAS